MNQKPLRSAVCRPCISIVWVVVLVGCGGSENGSGGKDARDGGAPGAPGARQGPNTPEELGERVIVALANNDLEAFLDLQLTTEEYVEAHPGEGEDRKRREEYIASHGGSFRASFRLKCKERFDKLVRKERWDQLKIDGIISSSFKNPFNGMKNGRFYFSLKAVGGIQPSENFRIPGKLKVGQAIETPWGWRIHGWSTSSL